MKSQMTIGKKLVLSFGLTLLILSGLSLSSWIVIGRMDVSASAAINQTEPKLVLFGLVNAAKSDMAFNQRGVVLYTIANNAERVNSSRKKFADNVADIEKYLEQMRPLLVTDEGKRCWAEIRDGVREWKPYFDQIVQLSAAGRATEAAELGVVKTLPIYRRISTAIDTMNDSLMKLAEQDRDTVAKSSRQARWIIITLSMLGAGCGVWLLFAIKQINAALRKVAGEMSEMASQVGRAANQLSESSNSLAQGSSEQASSLEQTAEFSNRINAATQQNSQQAQAVADLMEKNAADAERAKTSLGKMIESMNNIGGSSEKVSKIIKVIDEIAFQTNILALNAAVEAARAGEAGMGFAVVADEVRSLAQRCTMAARETTALIEESMLNSSAGKSRVDQVESAIRSMTESTQEARELARKVNAGSREQTQGVRQISEAISQMERVTQTTAANAEEGASASEELTGQARALESIVSELQMMVG